MMKHERMVYFEDGRVINTLPLSGTSRFVAG
jgi:hypothetical protein